MRLVQLERQPPAHPSAAPAGGAVWDLPINYQHLRHGGTARWLRGVMYRLLAGREGWPLVFEPPTDAGPQGTSEHLYIHLPFCRQLCPHCPYTKTLYRPHEHHLYGMALRKELEAYFAERQAPPVRSLYFGGGTPSVTPDLIRASIDLVRPYLGEEAEIGVEVHPGDASPDHLRQLREMGVNRISLGVETFRPDLLKLLGRTYTPEQAEAAIRAAQAAGFSCVDVNLICAIPGQTPEDTAVDVRRCLALGVEQISAYTLFTFVHTALGKRVTARRLSVYGDRLRLRAQRQIARLCREAGYERTSPWNYTRPGHPPYSTVTRDTYIGFGAGAASKVDGVFWFNTFSIPEYVAQQRNRPAIVLQTTARFRRLHWLYWRLYRTEVSRSHYQALFDRDLGRDFGVFLALLGAAGLVRRTGECWRVTEFGAIWMHRMQQLFSISYIDDVWAQCQAEAWPQRVVLA